MITGVDGVEHDESDWLTERLGELLGRPAGQIDPTVPIFEYGLDSVAALCLFGGIEETFGLYAEPTVVYDYPTVAELARYLAEEAAAGDPYLEVKP